MSQTRTNFYPQKKKSFICENCGKKNDDNQASPRNHCTFCLYSLHVDQDIPGDRKSECKSLMKPVSIDHSGKKGHIIVHECTQCQKRIRNKAMQDDNFELIITLSSKSQLGERT